MPINEEMALHLLTCYDTIYMVLGESAPTFTNDAFVVRTFEMGRAFGDLTLELRDTLNVSQRESFPVLESVLRRAARHDDSGALTLYAMAMVVGPRLLVSLLDARNALVEDETLGDCLRHGSQRILAEVIATGECAKHQSPIDDAAWQALALDLARTLDDAGNAESLGLSH